MMTTHLMALIDDEFARAIGRDLVKQAIYQNTPGDTPLNSDAHGEFMIAEEARPANIFGLIWRINALDDAIRDEEVERDAVAQLCSIVLRDACGLADAEYRRLLARKKDARSPAILSAPGQIEADPMVDLAEEVAKAGAIYTVDASEENERRWNAAVEAVIRDAKVTSLAGAMSAVRLIEDCGETFIDNDAAAAFKALAAWLRRQAAPSAVERDRVDLLLALKGKRKGRAA